MLYIMGKIALPDKRENEWVIKDVARSREDPRNMEEELLDKAMEALHMMNAWTTGTGVARQKLTREDPVEGIVFRMLEPAPEGRVMAGQIVDVLDGAGEQGDNSSNLSHVSLNCYLLKEGHRS